MPKKPTPTLPPDEASLPVVTQLPPDRGHPVPQLVSPIRSRHFLNLGAGRAFVSASAAWSLVASILSSSSNSSSDSSSSYPTPSQLSPPVPSISTPPVRRSARQRR